MLIPKHKGLIKVTLLLQGMTFSSHAHIHLCPFPTCVHVDREYGYNWDSYGIKEGRESFLQKELFSFPQFCHSLEKLFNSSESKRSLIKL